MILEKGDMWSRYDLTAKNSLFFITTNCTFRRDGALVMGRGIALQAIKRYPSIQHEAARLLRAVGYSSGDEYNIAILGSYNIGLFQVKYNWYEPADLDLIARSVQQMIPIIQGFTRVDLNFPGIGNGRLARKDVLPTIQTLPDNVHVWEYK